MTIRAAFPSDSADISRLTIELGYSADSGAISDRLAKISKLEDQLLLVAVIEENVAGWMQAHASEVLESGFRVEIIGLVVGKNYRRRGVGRSLVQRAEEWAAKIGAASIVVRSNTTRVESHLFYPALGFRSSKTQAVYKKLLKTN
jgi:predicted N-acetyltransferase YhbS